MSIIDRLKTKKWQVLLVEDDPDQLYVECLILEAVGIGFKDANDASSALSLVEQYEFDAIVTDLNLPDMSGIELCSILRNLDHTRLVPILALSAWASTEAIESLIANGANDYSHKGITPDEFIFKITHMFIEKEWNHVHPNERRVFVDLLTDKEFAELYRVHLIDLFSESLPEAILPVITLLWTDESALVRAKTVEKLYLYPDQQVLEKLLLALNDTSELVRVSALKSLRRFSGNISITDIIPILGDEDTSVRCEAVELLAIIGDGTAIEPIIDLLNEKIKLKLITTVTKALAAFGDIIAVPPLVQSIEKREGLLSFETRLANSATEEALQTWNKDYVFEFLLKTASSTSRIDNLPFLIHAMRHFIDPANYENLISFLAHNNANVKVEAINVLSGVRDPKVVDFLIPLLNDRNEAVIFATISALNSSLDTKCMRPILSVLEDKNSSSRVLVKALESKIVTNESATLSVVSNLLYHSESKVRIASIAAMTRYRGISTNWNNLVSLFNTLIKQSPSEIDGPTLRYLINVLGDSNRKSIAPSLLLAVENNIGQIQSGTFEALSKLKSKRIISRLVRLLESSEIGTKIDIVRVLGKTNSTKVLPSLVNQLENCESYKYLCSEIIKAIIEIDGNESRDILIQLSLDSNRPSIQSIVIEKMARLDTLRNHIPLGKLITDENLEIRSKLINMIQDFEEFLAVDALFRYLTDSNDNLRGKAVIELAKLRRKTNILRDTPSQDIFWRNVHHSLGSLKPDDAIERWSVLSEIAYALTLPEIEQNLRLCQLAETSKVVEIRRLALDALGNNKYFPSLGLITSALTDTDPSVRRTALDALGNIGDVETISIIKPLFDDVVTSVSFAAIKALVKIGTYPAYQFLVAVYDRSDRLTHIDILRELAKAAHPEALQILSQLTKTEDNPDTLRVAVSTLMQRDDEYGKEIISDFLQEKGNNTLREIVMELNQAKSDTQSKL